MDQVSSASPELLDRLRADVLTAALGSGDEGKERPTGAAGRVQGRGFKVPETYSSLGLGEPGAHDTRDKLTCIQTPV